MVKATCSPVLWSVGELVSHGDDVIYVVDVLQRVLTHPASETELLTPRLWKQNFAANPMGSILSKLSLAQWP